MLISVCTPAHNACNPYLAETYRSLCAQRGAPEWEWIILRNNGGETSDDMIRDPRVRSFVHDNRLPCGIGALKSRAFELARGGLIVELDGDDVLAPNALERIASEYARGGDFIYSDFAEFHDGTNAPNTYSACYGWRGYPCTAPNGVELVAMQAPHVTPQNMRSVMFAPNHVRAWSRAALERFPRDASLAVGDDQDLALRMYLGGASFRYIPETLYFYRVHPQNTVKLKNAAIQAADAVLYERHVEALALKFARDAGLRAIDLCSGPKPREGFTGADANNYAAGNVLAVDLNGAWPWPDGSVGVFRASDALEHLRDPIHVMNEAWRCLAPGGFFLTHTPSTAGPGAWADPTHVSFWNELAFRWMTDPKIASYLGDRVRARFALSRPVRELRPWGNVPYVEAHLIALKPGYHHMGIDLWNRGGT